MTQAELTEYNLGKSLDSLMTLDPRGYGVCNILYDAAYKKTGEPLSMKAGKILLDTLKEGDTVFIITGFVLHPYNMAETDGPPGAAALARSLIISRGIKPVFVVPSEALPAIKALSAVMGFHLRESLAEMKAMPLSAGFVEFTKSAGSAEHSSDLLCDTAKNAGCFPKFCIAIEVSGANKKGIYHNAAGIDVTAIQAKSDVLFAHLREKGVPSIAIGDLGNECGMASLAADIEKYIPRAAACECGCGGGILAAGAADTVLTATVSNWGAYGICAALAWLTQNTAALYTPELEERALAAANAAGLIDMYGWQIPSVDGMNLSKTKALITLMNECVLSAIELKETCKTWFDKIIELGYFEL
jgi:hypothetical protein